MYVARILYPVEVLGPGKRVGIWFCGCPRRCKGCSNPELWEFQERYKTTPETVFKMIETISKDHEVDGFTITGGDPMFQADDLQKLLEMLKTISEDIIVYTGYQIGDISPDLLADISVLIDGEYIEEKNDNSVLRGSSNQTIHILSEKYKERYRKYLRQAENRIQNFSTTNGIVSVGIHKAKFSFS